jgi:hypothetical protein
MLAERVARARALLDSRQWTESPRLRLAFACMLDVALRLYGPRLPAAETPGGGPVPVTGRQAVTPLEPLA